MSEGATTGAGAPTAPSALAERLEALGREVGEREAGHASDLAQARSVAESLHALVAAAVARFNGAAKASGAPHAELLLGSIRVDDKHLRALEFDLQRGRSRAIVTVKSRGDVTLVGPFHRGKTEGPCRTFPAEARSEIEAALGDFLARFVEEATAP
ncbi:MAG: hypothetical protein ACQGVK_14105 [Myxococcota bacterium]